MSIELLEGSTVTVRSELKRMKDFTIEELRREQAEAAEGVQGNVFRYAAAMRLREEKGEDVRRGMPGWLYALLRAIAYETAIPGLYILSLENERMAVEAMRLPIHEQRRILEEGKITVLSLPPSADAEAPEIVVNLQDATPEQIAQEIDPVANKRRTHEEKIQYLRRKKDRADDANHLDAGKFRPNRRRKIVSMSTPKGWIDIPFADIETLNEIRLGRL